MTSPYSPIQHIVYIVKENHTFDNYFGRFPGAEGMQMPDSPNPSAPIPHFLTHKNWLNREQTAVRAQFGEQDIPMYFEYARRFVLCDHYFTDVAGPSWPNHLMLITADSPLVDNPRRQHTDTGTSDLPRFKLPSLPALLDNANLTWGNYYGEDGSEDDAFNMVEGIQDENRFQSTQFVQDAKAGQLRSVSWVYAPHEFSEHPPLQVNEMSNNIPVGNVTNGMQWTVDQVNAIVQGGLWQNTVIFITWDDWGGWYDHVGPDCVESWSDGTPFRYGSRVPCLVLSPYAKSGYISKTLHSHASLVKFCETLFGLPNLNARDAAADDMSDCFDFTQAPLPAPPAELQGRRGQITPVVTVP